MTKDDTQPDGSEGTTEPAAGGDFERLAGKLVRMAADDSGAFSEAVGALPIRQQAELALRLPADQRLELLLHAPKPLRLVRALPDFELYLTVRQVGPSDALPLIALASASQLGHLLDLESWRGDRFDGDRAGAWVALLLEAGEPALRRMLRHADDEFLALLFQRWLRVSQIEIEDQAEIHGSGKTEVGDERGLVSPDGYHRFEPTIPEHAAAARRIAQLLFVDDPKRYQSILWSALHELPSSLEEHELRWRESRLEEHGFPTLEEALSIYAAPLREQLPAATAVQPDPDHLEAPRLAFRELTPEGGLIAAVELLDPAGRERTLLELGAIANRVLISDGADTGEPETHREALLTTGGYLRIALDQRQLREPESIAELLGRVPLIELFREGYRSAVELRGRALRHLGDWPTDDPRARELLDSPLRERVEALLEPRPLYVEWSEQGTGAVRPFRSPQEIVETRIAVEMLGLLGKVFLVELEASIGPLFEGVDVTRPAPHFSTLAGTALAWSTAAGSPRLAPLPDRLAADFRREYLWKAAPPEALERAVSELTDRLGSAAKLDVRDRTLLERFLKASAVQLRAELGRIEPGTPLDPRLVSGLWLA